MRKRLIQIAKWAWVVLVFGGVAVYLANNFDTVRAQLSSVSLPRLILAHVLLIGGKLLLVELSRQSVMVVDWRTAYDRMFYINSITQLAKYLPGGIWHHVGRAGFYRADGLPLARGSRAMILESIWLVSASAVVGGVFFALYRGQPLLSVLLIVVWWALLARLYRVFSGELRWSAALYVLGLQALIWTLLGLCMWVILPVDTPQSAPLAIGAFGISYAIGYVVIFAPGGIGVREAVLTAALAVVIAPSSALIYAAVNRLVWVISELILGFTARTYASINPSTAINEAQADQKV